MRVPTSLILSPKSARRSIAARFAGPNYLLGRVSGRGAGAAEGRTGESRNPT
jgi:hypothetical protein